MNQIQIILCSLINLFDQTVWRDFLDSLEKLIGSKLSHLDTSDPIRKKVSNLDEAVNFLCNISEMENSRTLFAKFGKSKVEMTITLYKDTKNFANTISIFFHEDFINSNDNRIQVIDDVFTMSVKKVKPFYSLGDYVQVISGKKKASGFSVNLQAELIGVFWLTYFSKRYVSFFGESKFKNVPCHNITGLDGMVVKLGNSPSVIDVSREEVEALLGKDYFVNPELQFDKPIGRNALKFEQLC